MCIVRNDNYYLYFQELMTELQSSQRRVRDLEQETQQLRKSQKSQQQVRIAAIELNIDIAPCV